VNVFEKKRLFGLAIFFFLLVPLVYSQQGKVEEAIKKKEKVERSYEKAYEKARKKTIKHRTEIQTKETRKSMKEAEKRAKQYNRQGKKCFLEALFDRKKSKK